MIPKTCSDCTYYDLCGLKCRLTGDHEWSTSGGCNDGEERSDYSISDLLDSTGQDNILRDATRGSE